MTRFLFENSRFAISSRRDHLLRNLLSHFQLCDSTLHSKKIGYFPDKCPNIAGGLYPPPLLSLLCLVRTRKQSYFRKCFHESGLDNLFMNTIKVINGTFSILEAFNHQSSASCCNDFLESAVVNF